jgi:hypothetical protein
MRIDSTGNVLIGAGGDGVAGKLTVYGSAGNFPIANFSDSSSGGTTSVWIAASNNTANGASLYMLGNGASTPAKTVRVRNGDFEIRNSGNTSTILSLTDAGSLSVIGEITAYSSDSRLKDNVQPITNALNKVAAINGVTFDWSPLASDLGFTPPVTHDVGVIAQEIQGVLPEAVRLAPFAVLNGGEPYLTVQYEKLTALLIEAVKELRTKVNDLEEQIRDMR